MSTPLPNKARFRSARQWMLDNLSIRQRLSLWYVSLLTLILALFSVMVYTVLQTQLQGSVEGGVKGQALYIAGALQGEQYIATPSDTAQQATPTPSAPQPTATPTANGTPSPTAATTPVATPNPVTSAKIQQRLVIKVPTVLNQLDLGFEVLDTQGRPAYIASSIHDTGLPLDRAVIRSVLAGGPANSYTAQSIGQKSVLLDIYVQPILLNPPSATATVTPGAGGALPSTNVQPQLVGVVLVAKPLEELTRTLDTLAKLLLVGDLIAILLASIGGWLIAEGVLRPIASITRTARGIAKNAYAGGLGTRVAYRGPRDEVGELVATFNDMLAALERVSNAQRRFVADASHELRAPLTTIKGSLEFLRRAPDLVEEERTAVLEDAYAEAERMAALVNDLLLLARADAVAGGSYGLHERWLDDQLRGRREPIELDQLAMDIFRHGRAQLRARRKDLLLSVTNLEPVTVLGDPGQIRQLAIILLDNAIKYTPAGGKVRLSVTRNGSRAALSISDSGIGIEPEVRQHIFERFYRGDSARERDQHGSGLGLAIARWIADAHQGEISVHSQPGQGSTFTLLLPSVQQVVEHSRPRMQQVRVRRRKTRTTPPIKSGSSFASLARLAESVSRPRRNSQPKEGAGSQGRPTDNTPDAKTTGERRRRKGT